MIFIWLVWMLGLYLQTSYETIYICVKKLFKTLDTWLKEYLKMIIVIY